METEWLNSDEVATLMGVQKKRVCTLARAGRLKGELVPKTRIGKDMQWRFSRAAFDEFMGGGGNSHRLVNTVPITASRDDILWFAGFFDGEGCITIQTRAQIGGGWHLSLVMSNTARELLYTLPALFGGSCHQSKFHSHQTMRQARWRASGRQAGIILTALLPFLRVKHRQAALGVEFQQRIDGGNHNSHRPMSDEERSWRDAAAARMKWLNHNYE